MQTIDLTPPPFLDRTSADLPALVAELHRHAKQAHRARSRIEWPDVDKIMRRVRREQRRAALERRAKLEKLMKEGKL